MDAMVAARGGDEDPWVSLVLGPPVAPQGLPAAEVVPVTCIVGLVDKGTVWIGGDSAGVSGWGLTVRSDAKVFRRGEWVFGFTGSFRMGQLIRYKLQFPRPPEDGDLSEFMATEFIDAVRGCLTTGGAAQKKDEVESAGGSAFLAGYGGRLFVVGDDYQVGEPADPYHAVGVGADLALGAMYASRGRAPQKRIEMALEAAERFSAGVRGPFTVAKAVGPWAA